VLSLGPEHAATIARDGHDKRAVPAFILGHGRLPLGPLGGEYRWMQASCRGRLDDDATQFPFGESLDAFSITVIGGAGKRSSWPPTFGRQTGPATRLIPRRAAAAPPGSSERR